MENTETKTLRLEGVSGKLVNQYVLGITVPGKLDLLNMIERPPFHIFSKDDTTLSTGILAFVPHSLKVRISRDYQEPFVGLYIKISPKSDELLDISEVKGTFTINPPELPPLITISNSANPTLPNNSITNLTQRSQSSLVPTAVTGYYQQQIGDHNQRTTYNNSNNGHTSYNGHQTNNNAVSTQNVMAGQVSFNFFKNSVSKLMDLESYDYYESRCHWPDTSSLLELYVKVTKTTYSVLVNDDINGFSSESSNELKDTIQSSSYFLSDSYSDVAIKVGESTFPAHKIILSERSQFFARMFANSMRETKEGIVRIVEEDESLFREILRFIYQGTVENLEENASELFILSDKYVIPELAAYCEKYLLKQLSVENAMEMFDLSQSILVQGILAKKSKELIMWNKDKFASDLQTFKDFSRKYPEIIFELLQIQ